MEIYWRYLSREEVNSMARKLIFGYLVAFLLAGLVMAGIVHAQSPSPSPSVTVTPTPTQVPEAPETGLGGGN
jgi:hypothetical protein